MHGSEVLGRLLATTFASSPETIHTQKPSNEASIVSLSPKSSYVAAISLAGADQVLINKIKQ
jgi:hypothetical protein